MSSVVLSAGSVTSFGMFSLSELGTGNVVGSFSFTPEPSTFEWALMVCVSLRFGMFVRLPLIGIDSSSNRTWMVSVILLVIGS